MSDGNEHDGLHGLVGCIKCAMNDGAVAASTSALEFHCTMLLGLGLSSEQLQAELDKAALVSIDAMGVAEGENGGH